MKKKYVLVIVLLLALILVPSIASAADGDVEINSTNFPDDMFRNFVSKNYDKDHDGVLSAEEAAAVTWMDVHGMGIESLDGLRYFSALEHFDCSDNKLTSLYFNWHKNLKSLDVSNNELLTYLKCECGPLTDLNVSWCSALTTLVCYGNELTSLDLRSCTSLKELYAGSNALTSLDLSHNTALETLHCGDNQLTKLDVSNCATLGYIGCSFNRIDSLDLSNNTELTGLYCSGNKLTELDLKNNTALRALACDGNALTSLDVSGHSSLEMLDVSDNKALKTLLCNSCALTSVDVSGCTALEELDCGINKMWELDVSECTALKYLNCYSNIIWIFDVSNNKELKVLYCFDNRLNTLDVTQNTALEQLVCVSNQLTELDLSANEALKWLVCYGNNITRLDISSCPGIVDAYTLGEKTEETGFGDLVYYEYLYNFGESFLGVDKDTEIVTERPRVTVSGISLNLEGKISVQFKIKPNDDAAYAQLRYENEDGTYGDVLAQISLDKAESPAYQPDNDLFLVSYSEITSREMTLHVMLDIVDKNGAFMDIYRTTNSKVYKPHTLMFCAADWANAIIGKYGQDKSNKSSWMAMALLNFGQEAQKYFKDFNSDAPANPNAYLASDMSSFKVDHANDNYESENVRDYGFSGSSLELAADTTLRVKFNGRYELTLDGKPASLVLDQTKLVLDIEGLRCIDLDQKFTIVFNGRYGNICTLKLSALGWCNAIIDKYGLDDTNQSSRLARAVCLYSQAAENYFAK